MSQPGQSECGLNNRRGGNGRKCQASSTRTLCLPPSHQASSCSHWELCILKRTAELSHSGMAHALLCYLQIPIFQSWFPMQKHQLQAWERKWRKKLTWLHCIWLWWLALWWKQRENINSRNWGVVLQPLCNPHCLMYRDSCRHQGYVPWMFSVSPSNVNASETKNGWNWSQIRKLRQSAQ